LAAFGEACLELGIAQKVHAPLRPQTNGEAERAIQSALRQWAYGRVYQHSDERRAALPAWDHRYNWHRRHHGIGCQRPMSRLSASRKNLVILHT
jgi:transposase InsO family protein